jgi:hypothetical protein
MAQHIYLSSKGISEKPVIEEPSDREIFKYLNFYMKIASLRLQ